MSAVNCYRPPELRARNGDPLEQQISCMQLTMLLADNWEKRAALWREILSLLRRRPPELIEQLERERLERARRGRP